MNAPVFLTREAVDAIHEASLAEFGGVDGIRNENALESALAQPMHEFFIAKPTSSPSLPPTPFTSPRTSRSSTETSAPGF
jgi:hypothetical protein